MHPSTLLGLLAFAAAVTGNPVKPASINNLKNNIKNVVVLVMENRSVDNLLGGQTIKGLENPINNGPFCNPYNVTDPSQGVYCSAAKDIDSVINDPDHGIPGNNMEFYGTFNPDNDAIASGKLVPHQQGFVNEQLRLYSSQQNKTFLGTEVMNYYTEEQVPVLTELVQNYVTFNHWHSDIPGPTYPNRAAIVSGTSFGMGTNVANWNKAPTLSQRSIFQQLTETGHSWLNYKPSGGAGDDALYFQWTLASNNTDKSVPTDQFFADAAAGQLPEFSYIGDNAFHPAGLVSSGEAFIKKVYEALRASPQWKDTLMILTFDETGGFHDHVPPPLAPRPDNQTFTTTTPSGESYTFEFDRLGGRVPTLLISPYVAKGHVEQKGVQSNGETVSYSATSILRTLGYLWDFEPFNPRVEGAASFDHLIRAARRSTPAKLPEVTPF